MIWGSHRNSMKWKKNQERLFQQEIMIDIFFSIEILL